MEWQSVIPPVPRVGEVPAYLKKRQAQWAQEDAALLAQQTDPDCPPGHVLLSQAKKRSIAEALRLRYARLADAIQVRAVALLHAFSSRGRR
jgi:hypothetical protein